MKKKIISLVIVVACLFALTIPVGACEHKDSKCDDCVMILLGFKFTEKSYGYWHCLKYPGTVFIEGKGPTYDFDDDSENSRTYLFAVNNKDSFFDQRKVVIFDGFTYLGNKMFSEYKNVEEIEIPDSVTEISETCFAKDSKVRIDCNKDSYALQFAKEHSMNYWVDDSDVIGDVNCDLEVNAKDALALRKHYAGYNEKIDSDNADVDFNGEINGKDIFKLRKFNANIITSF